jgi:hypothetical protein
VEHVDGGAGVGERAVAGRDRGAEVGGEGGEADVGDLVAGEQLAGQPGGADHPVGEPLVAVALQVGLEEAPVEGGVVGDQHGAAEELQQAGEHHLDGLGVGDHAVGDAGQGGDQRWDRDLGVDQGVEGAEHLAAADPDGADLRDPVGGGGAAGDLQVQDHELDVDEGRPEIIQGLLECLYVRGLPSRATCLYRPFLPSDE